MMKADIRWLDNPEIFRVNREDAHSDHAYYASYYDCAILQLRNTDTASSSCIV